MIPLILLIAVAAAVLLIVMRIERRELGANPGNGPARTTESGDVPLSIHGDHHEGGGGDDGSGGGDGGGSD
jgi:hypothetical protein